jgi:RNA polymerase sigma factor (sigma-70 family)
VRVKPDQAAEGLTREALDARYRRPLTAFFMRRAASRADADDLVQEVFVRMLTRGGAGDLRSADSFVFTIAGNLLRDRGRLAATRRASAHDPVEGVYDTAFVDDALVEHCDPGRVLLDKERLAQVVRALEELGERTRNIFVLYRLENMRRRDIAALYGITVSAVEKHIAKALDHLMTRLAP